MVTNEEGQVALVYYQAIPHVVKARQTEYAFVAKRAISLAWINPDDVEALLSVRRQCCGGNKAPSYQYANEAQVRIWNGAER